MVAPRERGQVGGGTEKGDAGDRGDVEMDAYRDDELTGRVIDCIIHVHRVLGPGFVENVYRRALLIELGKRGLTADAEKTVVIYYDGIEVGRHRLDILVEGVVILELKTATALCKAHYMQVRSYLKATRLNVALLVNFSGARADFRRVTAG